MKSIDYRDIVAMAPVNSAAARVAGSPSREMSEMEQLEDDYASMTSLIRQLIIRRSNERNKSERYKLGVQIDKLNRQNGAILRELKALRRQSSISRDRALIAALRAEVGDDKFMRIARAVDKLHPA